MRGNDTKAVSSLKTGALPKIRGIKKRKIIKCIKRDSLCLRKNFIIASFMTLPDYALPDYSLSD
jgi:hypothetical protein